MDEVLASVAETIKNFAVLYLVDITEVPDFNTMYELYDPSTVMFFFRNKHIMIDLGTGNNNKINWALKDKQEFIDVVETVYRGARKGRGLAWTHALLSKTYEGCSRKSVEPVDWSLWFGLVRFGSMLDQIVLSIPMQHGNPLKHPLQPQILLALPAHNALVALAYHHQATHLKSCKREDIAIVNVKSQMCGNGGRGG
ncbi:hypothetical protein TEA_005115 [Camellia sinensis var. sinensis]|uniref:Thioredoxin-like protein YLS8 n=1 Tax=Camellia sinensis var. sinensis TaxID=542762 RepID=A0A4S4EY40_CAMSN|nr:hypothetical protein TEA_005115 [Camellia sinensis var. sinensis]